MRRWVYWIWILGTLAFECSGMTKDEAIREMKTFRGESVKGVDTSTLTGKTICGYQGWFNTLDDGFDLGWKRTIPVI